MKTLYQKLQMQSEACFAGLASVALSCIGMFFVPLLVFAQSTPAGSASTPTGLSNPLNATSLQGLISEILGYAVQIGSIFLTIMLIYVGFQFVAARGNEEKLQSARNALLWTVIGGLILIGAQAIALAIASTAAAL